MPEPIDYYSTTGCRVGETDNYDSQTQLHHCLGLAKPSDADKKYAKIAMAKFEKATTVAQKTMVNLQKEAVAAQKVAEKKVKLASDATEKAFAMTKAVADHYVTNK